LQPGSRSTAETHETPPGGERTGGHATRLDIQGLRAIAVLLVALNHAGVSFLGGGYVGVDVFFVISGFLITNWLLRRFERTARIPFADFYAARARRILPAATLTLVATVLACWYFLNFVRALSAFHDALWATFFAANVHFADIGADYFAKDDPPSPVQHFWTLAVEEQFYIVWPIVLAAALLLARVGLSGRPDAERFARRRLAPIVGLCVLASFVWCVRTTSADPTGAYFSTVARAWELGVGALIAVCAADLRALPARLRDGMTWAGVGGILIAGVAFSSSTAFPGYAALLPVMSTALVIVGGLAGTSRAGVGRLIGLPPMRLVGDVSYTLYLWHWPVLVITAQYVGRNLSVRENLLLLAGAFGLSLLTYRLFENPIRHSRRLSAPRRALVLWPASVAAVVVLAMVAISSVGGEAVARESLAPIVPRKLDAYTSAVAASITPERAAMAIPSDLNPSIFALTKDRASGCVTYGVRGRPCALGDHGSRRRIAVFGDSHAAAWMPALDYFGRSRHWSIVPLITAGCTAGTATSTDDCDAPYAAALERARQTRPAVIVIAQYFDPREPPAATYAGLKTEIADFKKIAPRVIVIEDPPQHELNPIDCLLANGATLGSCSFSLSGSQTTIYSTVEDVAARNGAEYVHTLKWFCADGTCPLVIGKTITFRDTNHITNVYSRQLAFPLSRALTISVRRAARWSQNE
jgi:peptidoglycan/LPS O-acetylase OafA/YrhL